jgi:hypothetical protein
LAVHPGWNRGDRREAIFRDDADREALLAAPAEACAKTARRRCQPPHGSLKKINMTLSRTDPFTAGMWLREGNGKFYRNAENSARRSRNQKWLKKVKWED